MKTTIGKLFDITWGQKKYHSKESIQGLDGAIILISSKGEDNGAYGFFDIPVKYKAPFITVPSTGTIGQAFVQEYDCCVNDDVLILYPKDKMAIEELYQVAFQIRMNKWRYAYGRKITPKRLGKQGIKIINSRIVYKSFTKEILPKKIKKENIAESRRVQLINLTDLCKIEKKTALPQDAINSEGRIPYISSSSKNNGVVLFTDILPNFKGGSLTVAKDGNDGCSFFQPFDFISSLHNYVLTVKENYPKHILLYIGAVIKIKCYCYNHYYPLNRKHLEKMQIPIPVNDENEYDFAYIERLIKNCYGYKELETYL